VKNRGDLGQFTNFDVLRPQETVIGIYNNSVGESTDIILVTDLGIHTFSQQAWSSFDYDQIVEITTPSDKAAEGLGIRLKSENIFWLPVRGGEGRFRDTFAFLRFLDRVVDDMHKYNPLGSSPKDSNNS
jgi:hypothetical protein